MNPMSSSRVLSNLFLLALSTIFSLLLAELALRTFYPQTLGIWASTRDGLAIHPPNTRRHLLRLDQDVQINSLGFRDRERSTEKQPGTLRVLLLGDSFMEGLQVSSEQMFSTLLEKNLQTKIGIPIEVWNLSVSGWGTDDELTYLLRYGANFQPDLVLIAMTLQNDISDNLEERFHAILNGHLYERHQEIPPLGYAILQVKTFLAGHSHLYQMFLRLKHHRKVKTSALLLNQHVAGLLRARPLSELEKGWIITEKLLRKTSERIQRMGARTFIFFIPLTIQMSTNGLDAFLAQHNLTRAQFDVDQPQKRLTEIANRLGIPSIDLLPFFLKWTRETGVGLLVETDNHWNANGHALAADIVADEILKRGLLRRLPEARGDPAPL